MSETKTEHVRVLIVGSGPAGYTAAIYTSRANLKPVLIDGLLQGGQLTQTTEIENFPGFPQGRSGFELMDDMRTQAANFGADLRPGLVVAADLSKRPFTLSLDDGSTILADSLIVATGASPKHLGIADEEKYAAKGVSYCATCDGFFYRKKDVAVVGGGDTAAEDAIYLAGLANKVYLIVRRDALRATPLLQSRLLSNPKIEILWNSQTVSLEGNDRLERALLKNTKTGETVTINVSGFFIAIGHQPNTSVFPQLETDDLGYIRVQNPTQQTNIPGVFACGDVADPIYRQAITAAASGCRAAIDVERFLATHDQ